MNHTEAAQYIKATLTAFGPGEAISMTKETWAKIHEAMQALAQPEQEPVAHTLNCVCGAVWDIKADGGEEMVHTPDTTPPQRTWVGLTDEDVAETCGFGEYTTTSTRITLTHLARAIEAKLREKNA